MWWNYSLFRLQYSSSMLTTDIYYTWQKVTWQKVTPPSRTMKWPENIASSHNLAEAANCWDLSTTITTCLPLSSHLNWLSNPCEQRHSVWCSVPRSSATMHFCTVFFKYTEGMEQCLRACSTLSFYLTQDGAEAALDLEIRGWEKRIIPPDCPLLV